MNTSFIRVCAMTAAVIVSGCGGGGGGGGTTSGGGGGTTTPPPAGTTTFPFQKAFTALINSGSNNNFSVSGDCTGVATITTSGPGVQVLFQGVQGFSTATQQTLTLTGNCSTTSVVFSTTYYANATYQPIGFTINGAEWDKYQTVPQSMPATVAVNDAAVLSTLTVYSDNTYTTANGTRVMSYAILADGASTSTALVNYTTKVFDTANNLLYTEQDQYRIDTAGALALLNIDIQYSTTNTGHILLTKT